MYNLMIYFECRPGKRELFVERMQAEGILAAIRAEEGCAGYDYYFSEKDPNEILLIEAWETKEHQQVHLDQPHMDKMRAFKDDYIAATDLRVFEEQK